ncbi:MAG: signal peptidase II [Fibrobacter sp.]|jgi:signal peptidase II|nr:signal peptidase II [Fibrobacter sp.]
MKKCISVLNDFRFHIAFGVGGILLDQLTKFWAVSRFTDSLGHPNGEIIPALGNFLRFQLVYNEGAAFSSRPQDLIPFLSPTVFFLVLSIVALAVLFWIYRSANKEDWLTRLGIAGIISGACGNFIDRMRLGKVVDFIDSDFPDFIMTRFPTFNVADSFVTVSVICVFLSPFILKSVHRKKEKKTNDEN